MSTNRMVTVSEDQLKAFVIAAAKRFGWIIHHDLPAMNRRGRWATHVEGHPGFPDLVLAHKDGDLLFVELKSAAGRVSTAQQRWLNYLALAGIEVHLWRPEQVHDGSILQRLARQ